MNLASCFCDKDIGIRSLWIIDYRENLCAQFKWLPKLVPSLGSSLFPLLLRLALENLAKL
jgi:hypothetical protein